ncbi:MAG: hypothetical protein Q8M04_02640, partial [Pseudomonadota bacterium]|nr:hypothetical protein [Pseudomonadota bacterium]
NIANFTTHYGDLQLATAAPYEIVAGREAQAEVQRIVFNGDAKRGSFTLTLSHGGQDYTTAAIQLSASQAEVQAALDAAFTLAGAEIDVAFWSGKELRISFGGSLSGQDIAALQATVHADAGSAVLAQMQQGHTETLAATAAGTLVVDYSVTELTIATGPSSTVTFDMDGARGELLQARGNLEIDLFGFFQVSGGFAIEKGTDSVTLADGVVVEVDLLTIGASNVDAFAGVGGGSADAVGLQLGGVEFGLVLASDKLTPTRSWTALQASAADVAFVGIDGLTLAADTIDVAINQAAADGSLIDWLGQPLAIATGPATSLTLELDGQAGPLIRASGNLDIDLFGFVQLSGGFAIEKSEASLEDADGVALTVDLLTIGASNVNAFAGLNGNPGGGKPDAIGLQLTQVDFGLALVREQTAQGALGNSWTTLQATAGSAAFVGVDGMTVEATEISLEINRAAADGSVIDYAAAPLEIATGPGASLALNLDGRQGELLRASGMLEIDLFGFVQLDGGFAIEKSSSQVRLADNPATAGVDESATPVEVDLLSIGASGVNAFAGLNGGTAGAIGLQLLGVEFALALVSEKNVAARKWTSLQATADSVALIGIDGLTMAGEDLGLAINQAAADGSLIDYAAQNLVIATGPGSTLALDLDGGDGELLRASGHLSLDAFGFFQVEGDFALEKKTASVTLNDASDTSAASVVDVDLLTVGASGLTAFAGLNGGTADALGLALSDVEFGLALMTDRANAQRSWTSLQASVGGVGFVGLGVMAVSATELTVEINLADTVNGHVVDFAAAPLNVLTGPANSLELGMDGSRGELIRAVGHLSIDLVGFIQVEGDLAFEKTGGSVTLDSGEVVAVDLLTLGANDLSAFVGMNGGTADALGLKLSELDLALALMTDRADPARSWTSLQALAGGVAFVGIDGLTIAADTISVGINLAASDDSVVDYSTGKTDLTVVTGPASDFTFSLDGGKGELIQAAGHLELNVFNFFMVEGDLAFTQQAHQAVTLSDGSEIDARMLSIGGANINAFAGLNGNLGGNLGGGTPSALGLSLGQVGFALALITDRAHLDRKYTSLQATAGLAEFIGVDGLTVAVDTLAVNVNQGVVLAAQPEVVTTANTRIALGLEASTIGTLTFARDADSADVVLTGRESNAQVIARLTAALESLDGIGTGNVAISGNRIAGYDIEFIGALAGQDVAGLTVAVAAADLSATVSQTQAAQSGTDEIKRISIESLRAAPAPIDLEISQVAAASLGGNEIKTLLFTTPYSTKGLYDLALSSDPADKVSVRFVQNDIVNNKRYIREGLADLLNVNEGSIVVTFDNNSPSGHRYNIEFLGALGGTDIPDLIVTESLAGDILPLNQRQGGGGSGEIQRVLIDTTATGSFTLSLAYNGQTHTTTALAFGASAATVQSALNTALAGIGGSTTVVSNGDGAWRIQFGGSLV